MEENSEEKKVSLGGAIIACVITLIIGGFIGLNWNTISANVLPYLGFAQHATSSHDWSALDEVYNALTGKLMKKSS